MILVISCNFEKSLLMGVGNANPERLVTISIYVFYTNLVPKGALVCISPAESHHDETIFDDPYAFKPERWLSTDYWATRAREMSFVQW